MPALTGQADVRLWIKELSTHLPQDMTQVDAKLSSFAQELCHLAPITAWLTATAFPIIAAAALLIH